MIGQTIYKYRPVATEEDFDRAIDVISKNEVWFSDPLSFNDPFDCCPVIEVSEERPKLRKEMREFWRRSLADKSMTRAETKIFLSKNRMSKDEIKEISIRQWRETISRFGIFSCSKTYQSCVMWAHYASNHNGVCFAFLRNRRSDIFYRSLDVVYQGARPRLNHLEMAPKIDSPEIAAEYVKLSVQSKASEWSYEKEVRVFDLHGSGLKKFDPKSLVHIIIGANVEEKKAKIICDVAKASVPHASISRAIPEQDRFGIRLLQGFGHEVSD